MQANSIRSCILSKFYIKPQPSACAICCQIVVSYRNSTSNHNMLFFVVSILRLYLIEILHQTTTREPPVLFLLGCILSKFYIKPQPSGNRVGTSLVVSYRNSTSNHNLRNKWLFSKKLYLIEILHQTTTSFALRRETRALYLIEILHQTTTADTAIGWKRCCILSKFYIKPQRLSVATAGAAGCILSKFYIKPQHFDVKTRVNYSCILSKFYIKPQQLFALVEISRSCILSKFYIKPQHCSNIAVIREVVSYRNSTSNHNLPPLPF